MPVTKSCASPSTSTATGGRKFGPDNAQKNTAISAMSGAGTGSRSIGAVIASMKAIVKISGSDSHTRRNNQSNATCA